MILGKLKTYALLILSGLVAVLAFLLKIFGSRSRRLKQQAETYKAQANRARVVAERDNEIEGQTQSRRADAAKELKETGGSSTFRDPNKLFDDDPD